MSCFLGIDIGTSSTKSLIMSADGEILGIAQKKYDILRPKTGYAEQDMDVLWEAVCHTLQELCAKYPYETKNLQGIGYSGQMHGLVMVDHEGKLLRNGIIWEDQRSIPQIDEVYDSVSPELFHSITMNTLSTGYLISSLLWVRKQEPDIYERIARVMLPKDYIRFRMCGEIGTDMSDASSTVIFDTANRTWAWELIRRLGIPEEIFPPCHEAYETAGEITDAGSRATGLKPKIPVVYGGGDTLMHEVGTYMIGEKRPWVANIGTSCQVTCAMNRPLCDTAYRTNTFCHVKEDLWMLMSCGLCGGAAMKWIGQSVFHNLSFQDMNLMAEQVPVGSDGLIFLPHLNGSRSPDNDPRARGMFMGLKLNHTGAHFIRSIMEGIVFSLKDSMNLLEEITGSTSDRIIASGGGARGDLFLQMEADIFDKPVYTTKDAEQSCIGAAITAAVGTGYFKNYEEACEKVVRFSDRPVEPVKEHVKIYEELFPIYHRLYRQNKELFAMYK